MSSGNSPGIPWTPPPLHIYPQRRDTAPKWIESLETNLRGLAIRTLRTTKRYQFSSFVESVKAYEQTSRDLNSEAYEAYSQDLSRQLRTQGFDNRLVAQCFAHIREGARRTLGMPHYDVQLMGGRAMLSGKIAEMETGEGKTLTATLTAGTAALAKIPVHIVTANDYLAKRDAETMAPLYEALGLSVGTVVHGMPHVERRAAYNADITYCSNKEIAFDYLRDCIALGGKTENLRLKIDRIVESDSRTSRIVMRGLHFAIVDEADSVFIDEARTPLVISKETNPQGERQWAEQATSLTENLREGEHYRLMKDERRIELTERGKDSVEAAGNRLGGMWQSQVRREEGVRLALSAAHLFQLGDHYLVRDGKVQIVDEYTGRIMEDRSWNDGLHQLVEFKEKCDVTGRKVPIARISYQRFFRRYLRLAGMTGTAREVAGEIWSVYGLPVVRVPTNAPLRRTYKKSTICSSVADKWNTVVAHAHAQHETGRPVLIGTRSVAASEELSRHLKEAGLEHAILNAAQDKQEADVIERAGEAGWITVATNMAGRGVDVRLDDEVVKSGGMHVILSERHDARRIDRQLAGRCARQGDPGTFEAILSLEDPLLDLLPAIVMRNAHFALTPFGRLVAGWLFDIAQWRAERVNSNIRRQLLKADRQLGTLLAFSGNMD